MGKKERRPPKGRKAKENRTAAREVKKDSGPGEPGTQTALLEPGTTVEETAVSPSAADPEPVTGPNPPEAAQGAGAVPDTMSQSPPPAGSVDPVPSDREPAEKSQPADESIELLGFTMNQEEYAIPVSQIKEIIRVTDVTFIPGSSPILLGIISLRGVIIPVFKLGSRLANENRESELPAQGQGETIEILKRIIIVQIEDGYFGMLVDGVTDVIKIREGEIEPPPPLFNQQGQEMILGLARFKKRLIILLSIDRIVDIIQSEIKVIRTS
jgi:purine-binding chemotaxis protein CheW